MTALAETERRVDAKLVFAVAAGRTRLHRQYIPYPLHITRPFYLNPSRPDLTTLYLQSASGGLYAQDDISLVIDIGPDAAAHITTPSATSVHECRDGTASLSLVATVRANGFVAVLPDPLVLFPGADLATSLDLTLHDGARAILAEGASLHDPRDETRVFRRFHGTMIVRDQSGTIRIADRGGIEGSAAAGPGVLGHARAWGTLLLLAPLVSLPPASSLETTAEEAGCFAGTSPLPHGLGLGMRLLAPDGGTLKVCIGRVAAQAAQHLTGCRLATPGK